jgi:hypothetical protein
MAPAITRNNAAAPMTAAAIIPTWVEGPPEIGEVEVDTGDTVTGPRRGLTEEAGWLVKVAVKLIGPFGGCEVVEVVLGDGVRDDVEDAVGDATAKCPTDTISLVVEQARIVDSRSV